MAKIPACVTQEPLSGLKLLRRGKVRDTYALPDPKLLLVVASDRVSIFDFVLPAFVAQKGAVLTSLNDFWRASVLKDVAHDRVATGDAVSAHLPTALRDDVSIKQRTTIVRKLDMLDCEAIVRGSLTGSGLKAYRETRIVCGHRLPKGLEDGDALPFPVFTPSTKAEEGHDEHVTADSVAKTHGVGPERLSLQLFALAQAYARDRGILLADTKFEFGRDPETGELTLGDEVLTPDSSRFWDLRDWKSARTQTPRTSPTSFDKQYVREWGKARGINVRDPSKPADLAWVHAQEVPTEILERTTRIYRYIFWRLTGRKLERYQRDNGLDVRLPNVAIEIVSGSESDLLQMHLGLTKLERIAHGGHISVRRHVISCHRHPDALAQFARDLPNDRVVIAGAGMAAALPGVLKALLVKEGKTNVPVIGVAFEGQTKTADLAAQLSIEQLPEQPVVLDSDGKAYAGSIGFLHACEAAVEHEFLETPSSVSKPAKLNVPPFEGADHD